VSAAAAFNSLVETLRTTKIRVEADIGQTIVSPPALVVAPPELTYDVYSPEPSEAQFEVALVAAQDERAVERLFALLPAVQQAVHDSDDAALTAAKPGHWGSSPSLPCYLLTIEVAI